MRLRRDSLSLLASSAFCWTINGSGAVPLCLLCLLQLCAVRKNRGAILCGFTCICQLINAGRILNPGHKRQPTDKKLCAAACWCPPQRLSRSVSNGFICAAVERTCKEHVNPNWVPLDTQRHVLPVCRTSLEHGSQCVLWIRSRSRQRLHRYHHHPHPHPHQSHPSCTPGMRPQLANQARNNDAN